MYNKYNNRKNSKLFLINILTVSSLLAGCGNTIPEVSEAEQEVITEYATNLLVKYSPISGRKLLNDTQLEEGIAKETEEAERLLRTEEIAQMYRQASESGQKIVQDDMEAQDKDTQNADTQNGMESLPQKSISQFFAEDSKFSIDYTSYSLCDSYPEDSDEEFFVAMDATEGNQLCIVKFQLENLSSSEQELDMFAKQGRFSLRMGDGTQVSAQSTLLADDLSSYVGNVPTGEKQELVLVFEVPDTVEQIDSMQLIMRDQSGENILTLQ